jgi:hypothetical protein
MSSSRTPKPTSSTSFRARLIDRVLYGIVRRLDGLSRVLGAGSPNSARADHNVQSREFRLTTFIEQLRAEGFLELRDDDLATMSEIKLTPTGSSVNVAIIPEDVNGRPLVLKFTESAVASAELAKSSSIQEQLTSDLRLSSWSSYIPQVVASGTIGTTAFAIEQRLSSRNGSAAAGDLAATNALIAEALSVIHEFHRVTARDQHVEAQVLGAIVDRPIGVLRANTPAGIFRHRAGSIDRLETWLRRSLVGHHLEIGWTHGDFHLGNVLIDDHGDHVVGVVDWGRAESDGLTVLDGLTLLVLERAKSTGQDIGSLVLDLLRDVNPPSAERAHVDDLTGFHSLFARASGVDPRCLLMLTWLKHVANNLQHEDRTRSHGLWRLRNVDLVLYGAAEIVDY